MQILISLSYWTSFISYKTASELLSFDKDEVELSRSFYTPPHPLYLFCCVCHIHMSNLLSNVRVVEFKLQSLLLKPSLK